MTDFDLATIGTDLPVLAAVGDVESALAAGACVVQAPPGTGKTTLVPAVVANAVSGRVIVTQPRRVAARAAARRLASLDRSPLGERVGYVVRGDRQISAATRVEFCTAGVLLRRLLADPELAGIDAVVLDEVHERSLETDLTVAMLAEVRQLRPDLRLIAMSATVDAQRWAALLGEDEPAPVVAVEAPRFPLEVRWSPGGTRTDARGVAPSFLTHVSREAADLARELGATVLCFVPGARECEQVAEAVRALGVAADPLHGSLDARAQDRVLNQVPGPRVMASTSIAESSLTVAGVRGVVDSGLAREPRYDAGRHMTGLVTVTASKASCEQRAGRAVRLGPGVVVRCMSADEWPRLRPFVAPEILTADLTQAALDLAVWGAPGGRGLPLLDAPPARALANAEDTLRSLGAVDEQGVATLEGRRLAAIPVDPRLARGLLTGASRVGSAAAAEIIALVSGDERIEGADIVKAWRTAPAQAPWRREARRLESLVPAHPRPAGMSADETVARVVAAAYPDQIARRRGDEYLLASGTAAVLSPSSALAGQEWIVVAQTARVGERAVIRAAAALPEDVLGEAASTMRRRETHARWENGRVTAREISRLGAIELSRTSVTPTPDLGRAAVVDALRERGLGLIWSDAAEGLRRRLALLHAVLGEPWPAVDDASLLASAPEWLATELDRLAQGAAASSLDIPGALRRLVPWQVVSRLDEWAPERIEVPTGSRIRVDYPADPADRVVVAVKLQECFGLTQTPTIVDGRVPVLLHLLSPAQRPLAVTDDLASFWANAYPGVRAENRGRYAKHPWPEDPLTAPPRRGTTRSGH